MRRRIIPDVIDGQQALCCLSRDATAAEAAALMRERRIGAVLVVEKGALLGIVTERDLVFRLLAEGRDAAATAVGAIMTPDPQTIGPADSMLDALKLMQAGRYRHLPVLDGGGICGMVSIRDLFQAVRSHLEEELRSAETLIYGETYGAAALPQ